MTRVEYSAAAMLMTDEGVDATADDRCLLVSESRLNALLMHT